MRSLYLTEVGETQLPSGLQLILSDADGRMNTPEMTNYLRDLGRMKPEKAGRQARKVDWEVVLPAGIMAVRLYHFAWDRIDQEHLECGTHASVFCRRHETWHTLTMFYRVPEGFVFPEPGLHPGNHFGAKVSYYAPGTAVKVPPSKGCKWVRPLPDDLTTLSELPRLFWPLDEPDPCN